MVLAAVVPFTYGLLLFAGEAGIVVSPVGAAGPVESSS